MSELMEQVEEASPDLAELRPRVSRTGLFILACVGLCCWVAAMLLPDKPPLFRTGSMPHWIYFGQQILRDILRAVGLLALAIIISAFVPQIGLFLERIILHSRRRTFLIVTAGLATVSSALFSYVTLAHMPHIQDEIAMLFQAKVLAAGRLYAHTPSLIDFFDYEFVIADGPRWYSKYFLTPSLVMVPGVWAGVPWLVAPILSGLAVLLTYGIGVNLLNDRIARVAVVLMVISPFRVSLFAMMMAHPSCMVAMGLFTLGMIKIVKDPRAAGWALAAGIGLALAINCRPLTALMLGGVVGVVAAIKFPWRQLRFLPVAAFALPVALGLAGFFAYNWALTGDPMLTPFTKWSSYDHLGFGPEVGLEYAPKEDIGHSLTKALFVNTYYNLDAIGGNLTGWGHITLVLLVWPLLLTSCRKRTLALAACVASLAGAYFFYYTPSVIVGQARYWSESMPMMLLIVAIALAAVREALPWLSRRLEIFPAVRTGRAACWLAAGFLTIAGIKTAYLPLLDQCDSLWGQGPLLRDLCADRKLKNAIVFVQADHYREFARKRRWDYYAAAFPLNTPDLDGPIIFARDLGERNEELIREYPGRSLYRIDLKLGGIADLEPLTPQTATQPALSL